MWGLAAGLSPGRSHNILLAGRTRHRIWITGPGFGGGTARMVAVPPSWPVTRTLITHFGSFRLLNLSAPRPNWVCPAGVAEPFEKRLRLVASPLDCQGTGNGTDCGAEGGGYVVAYARGKGGKDGLREGT